MSGLSVLARFLNTAIYFFVVSLTVVFVVAVVIYKYLETNRRRPVHVAGRCAPHYEELRRVFRENLKRGWERDGAAFAVYKNGECVVDLWGGYADRDCQRLWSEDTMNVTFSTSKAVGALCVALLVDRGLLDYDDLVVTHWPAFGRHGKERTTVQMILSHTAGLAHLNHAITLEEAYDHEAMARIFEEAVPNWEPGTHVGYQALTFGWLVDQIVRRVDPQRRGVSDFYRQEIAEKHDIDYLLGIPPSEAHRVARMTRPGIWDRISEYVSDPKTVDYGHVFKHYLTGGLMVKVANNPEWLNSVFRMPLNNPDLYGLQQCAVSGIGTARALAKLFDRVRAGKIISMRTLARVEQPVLDGTWRDLVTAAYQPRGHGFTHHHYTTRDGRTLMLLGHSGFGGQNVRLDSANGLALGYVSNGLKGGLGDRARTYTALLDALYKCDRAATAASKLPSSPIRSAAAIDILDENCNRAASRRYRRSSATSALSARSPMTVGASS